jgi:hypothetical protein
MNEKPIACRMVILEDGDFNIFWECSVCLARHKDSNKLMKKKECPSCGSEIRQWIGMDDEEDE